MAKCVELPIPQPVVNSYQLTLSQDEAETLMIITHNVGGIEQGRRGHNTSIQQALLGAGVKDQCLHPDKIGGSIVFKDTITAR